jgi:hypothetical protein
MTVNCNVWHQADTIVRNDAKLLFRRRGAVIKESRSVALATDMSEMTLNYPILRYACDVSISSGVEPTKGMRACTRPCDTDASSMTHGSTAGKAGNSTARTAGSPCSYVFKTCLGTADLTNRRASPCPMTSPLPRRQAIMPLWSPLMEI